MYYIAFCTKGLEKIVKQELSMLAADVSIAESGTKRIVFDTNTSFQTLVKAKTVDDLAILIDKREHVIDFMQAVEIITSLDFEQIRKTLKNWRDIEQSFSLTIGTSGVKNYTSQSLTKTLSEQFVEKYGWEYTPRDHTNFDIRIFIDHTTLYVTVRLTKESLYQRSYRIRSQAGSLKPTVAAAMVRLATQEKKNLTLVDNFCGSGTILCESYQFGNIIYGGDIDPESVVGTKENLQNLGFTNQQHIKQLDATNSLWPDNFFDCAVSNLPWNKQVAVTSITDLYHETLQEYARIIKPEGVLCCLVSKLDLFIKYAKQSFPNHRITNYKLGMLGQTPTIVLLHA